jgi:tetratricopeptide (TPR) repeat protein
MSVKTKRFILVIGACTLFVLLYFAPKIADQQPNKPGLDSDLKTASINSNLEVFLNVTLKGLSENQKLLFNQLQTNKKYDSLILFWDQLKRPDLSAHFSELKAKTNSNFDNWLSAGKRYYNACQFTQDQSELPVLFQCALRCFNNALQKNPTSNDAKIMKGSCLVEGAGNPMDGIAILKEIEKTDSNNVQLQLTFAFFSIKSGQLDKAIQRFNKVLKADSTYIEAYLHLADVYEQLNKPEETINMLNKYLVRTNDETSKAEINKYIQQLKTNINK